MFNADPGSHHMSTLSPSPDTILPPDAPARALWLETAEMEPTRRPNPIIALALQRLSLVVERRRAPTEVIAGFEVEAPALAVIELGAGPSGGLGALEMLQRQWPSLPIMVVSESPTVPDAVHALRAGAVWYGGSTPEYGFERALREALERRAAGAVRPADRRSRELARGGRIVGSSPAICRMLRQSALVAPTRTTVLLLGETGTGKERLAQAIHEASPRRHGPFVAVNCAALSEGLLESELFGHERGAFSGAQARREGRFKSADGGTIFLDEVGELSLSTQVRLLRVLQERQIERVGGNQTLEIDVRVIAATHRNLREMVEDGSFRADLFYRLNVMTIDIPPLRQRQEDIPLLAEHLGRRLAQELGLPECPITPAAMRQLQSHDWPGNVRELENSLQRALVMAEGAPIASFDLVPARRAALPAGQPGGPVVPGASFREIERHAIMTTYEACGRSPVRTAEMLGISPRTVHYRLREYRGDPGRRLASVPVAASAILPGRPRLHVVRSAASDAEAAEPRFDESPRRC
jgi:DNA-binding NtrC family response regulator